VCKPVVGHQSEQFLCRGSKEQVLKIPGIPRDFFSMIIAIDDSTANESVD
jgi:hypothetical protein